MKKAFFAAFPLTLPIMTGFLFLGMTYGVYMHSLGFCFLYPMLMALLIFAGSMEFVTASLLLGPFQPLQALLLTLLINARHLFYGISMLGKFESAGKLKPYLIFGMCDESFSINYSADIPPDVNRTLFMFWVTLLNQFYWVAGATLGGLAGGMLNMNLKGLEFVMTTLFVVIFLEQLLKEKRFSSGAAGILLPALSLWIFGKDHFMIPSMILILAGLTLMRPLLDKEAGKS